LRLKPVKALLSVTGAPNEKLTLLTPGIADNLSFSNFNCAVLFSGSVISTTLFFVNPNGCDCIKFTCFATTMAPMIKICAVKN